MRSDLVDISCEIRHETEKAVLIFDGREEVWLPRSLTEVGDREVTIPEWLAQEKGLL